MRHQRISVFLIILFAVSAGCAGEEKTSANKVRAASTHRNVQVPDTTQAPATREPVVVDTTSSEPASDVYRGYLVIESERQSFQACGRTERSWIVDLTGQELTDVYASLAINPGDPIFVEFQGLLEPPPDVGFGADYANQIKVLELRRAALEGPGCNEDL